MSPLTAPVECARAGLCLFFTFKWTISDWCDVTLTWPPRGSKGHTLLPEDVGGDNSHSPQPLSSAGSTHGVCARRGGIKLSSVLPKLARVKWHKATGRAGQSFKFRGNIWDEREERKKELSME